MSGLIGVSDINLDTSGPFLRCPSLTMEPAQISFLLFPAIYLKMSDFFNKTNYVPGKKIYTLILIGAFLTFTFTIDERSGLAGNFLQEECGVVANASCLLH